ncbi:hypothetical protein Tsp_02084 [Trichinella spiralis]|uniref:hypothetical protein n=1 Tax=Trichinella spiralis TaxID=6334 RepID=UPI0001EFBEB9|nr:hypothetical protein Tsp_02084 [Trichinella spiralis]
MSAADEFCSRFFSYRKVDTKIISSFFLVAFLFPAAYSLHSTSTNSIASYFEKYQEFLESLETLFKIFTNFDFTFLRTSLFSNLLQIFKENTRSTNPRVSSALNLASWGGVSVKFDFRSESQGIKSLPTLLLTDNVYKSSISPAVTKRSDSPSRSLQITNNCYIILTFVDYLLAEKFSDLDDVRVI